MDQQELGGLLRGPGTRVRVAGDGFEWAHPQLRSSCRSLHSCFILEVLTLKKLDSKCWFSRTTMVAGRPFRSDFGGFAPLAASRNPTVRTSQRRSRLPLNFRSVVPHLFHFF